MSRIDFRKMNLNMSAKVSVVIPVYKVEKYIERCVRSLFEQTLDSIEYIFVDDCSPDNSIAVMEKVLAEYPHRKDQVKIIRHEVNQGVGAARKHGVAACTGDYVIHCDSDDWVDLNFYEMLFAKATAYDADLVYCPVQFCGFTKNDFVFPQKDYEDVYSYLFSVLSGESHPGPYNKLVRRKIAQSPYICMPEHIHFYEDLLYLAQMIYLCKKVRSVADALYHYECNAGSLSNRVWPRKYFLMMEEIADILEKKLLPAEKFSGGIAGFRMELLSGLLLRSDGNSAAEYYHYAAKYKLIRNLRYIKKSYLVKILMLLAVLNYPFAIKIRDFYKKFAN